MNFNSWQFLVFFPVVWALYLIFAARFRRSLMTRLLLLASSLFFYACWNPAYLVLILFSVAVTWTAGLLMEGRSRARKKLILALSLVLNLAILFFFKYYNFFAGTVNALFAGTQSGAMGVFPALNVLLPAGISFYTFQALGYSVDVYRGTIPAERNLITYALFVTFFPQLVAGPIERTASLLPQFTTNHHFDYDRVTAGLKLAAWGMFKKVMIADRLAIYVNAVYENPGVFPAPALLLATFLFAFQIYCDFSGYSDIAVGTAQVLGFRLMANFRAPYFAASIGDFWRRWHISLSTWLKDYVYIPLGGNRKGALRRNLNLLITFALSGLWHGAAWHFVFWGLLHGLFQIIERSVGGLLNNIRGKSPPRSSRFASYATPSAGVSPPQRPRIPTFSHGVSEKAGQSPARNSRSKPVGFASATPPNHGAEEMRGFETTSNTRGFPAGSRSAVALRVLATFALVCLAWVFFRAESLSDAVLIVKKFTTFPAELVEYARRIPEMGLVASVHDAFSLGSTAAVPVAKFGIKACALSFAFIAVLLAASWWTRGTAGTDRVKTLPPVVRWAGYYALVYALVLVILRDRPEESSQFIYFTF
ncbi:MAG: hypothetical protein LBT00_10650 [Spirochaetaceae bacterium]|jgi:D-alanyl-lipoteichoic acid acyltransferase DltB (MBOAT superfamily)|nr:hypothetical protein [Spirochaetaceae bacterium]